MRRSTKAGYHRTISGRVYRGSNISGDSLDLASGLAFASSYRQLNHVDSNPTIRTQALVYPLDVVKTRLAASSAGDYNGIMHCLQHSVRKEGVGVLFKGLKPALLGIVPAAGVDLAVYNTLRDWHAQSLSAKYTEELERQSRLALDPRSDFKPSDLNIPPPETAPPIWLSLCFGAVS